MTICCRIGHWVRWENPPANKKQRSSRRRDNIERFPGESRGPSLGGRSGGSMEPGFPHGSSPWAEGPRESGLGWFHPGWVGRAGRWGTREQEVGNADRSARLYSSFESDLSIHCERPKGRDDNSSRWVALVAN